MPEYFASPAGGRAIIDGVERDTMPLETAVVHLTPGDTLRLADGTYTTPVIVSGGDKHGPPIIIRGGDQVILDGGKPRTPVASKKHMTPTEADFHFVRLQGAQNIVLEQLQFVRCWPVGVFIRGCRDVVIRDSTGVGGQFMVFARSMRGGDAGLTRGLTLDNVRWKQDPEGLMWSGKVSWPDIKRSDARPEHRCFNGGLLGSYNILGDVRVTGCTVSHAFNGIRLDAPKDVWFDGRRNINVRIDNCLFEFIRDNAVEPEKTARNWWVHHNRIRNTHAVFSLHHFRGEGFYIFANRIWFDSQTGDTEHNGGKIFKFDVAKDGAKIIPEGPFYIFHNSVFMRSSYVKTGYVENLRHYNNALSICRSGDLCSADRHPFKAGEKQFEWRQSYEFKGDACDHPDFPDQINSEMAFELDGIPGKPLFRSPGDGDLRLADGSPAKGKSSTAFIKRPDASIFYLYEGRDIGAFQGDALYGGPAYQPVEIDEINQ